MDTTGFHTSTLGEDFIGATLASVDVCRSGSEDKITFYATDGRIWEMRHDQDCYEIVSIDDICGNIDDLVGAPILSAEESWKRDDPDADGGDSQTWTFYRITTFKGTVVIRWHGENNGYYSEDVDFCKVR